MKKKTKTSPSAKLNFAEGDVFGFSVKYFFIHFLIFETKAVEADENIFRFLVLKFVFSPPKTYNDKDNFARQESC